MTSRRVAPGIDPAFELAGRHPVLARTEPVATWIHRRQLRSWSESRLLPDGSRVVTCEPRERHVLFVALIMPGGDGKDEIVVGPRLEKLGAKGGRSVAIEAARKRHPDLRRVIDAIPHFEELGEKCPVWHVRYLTQQKWIAWERVHEGLVVDLVVSDDCVGLKRVSISPPACTKATPELDREALAQFLRSDELHHVGEFAVTATLWGGPSADPSVIADEVLTKVNETFSYEVSDVTVGNLTYADHPACTCLHQRGQCDELAVFMTTLLRARGVPAREVFVTGEFSLRPVAHACVEWWDGSRWVHADPTWSGLGAPILDDPGIYGVTGLDFPCVTRPGVPLDALSNLDSNETPDPDGDDAIHPLCDWQLLHALPGVLEPPYSDPAQTLCAVMGTPPCGRQ